MSVEKKENETIESLIRRFRKDASKRRNKFPKKKEKKAQQIKDKDE